jgi:magnesium-transporting ATPase (P-type)
LKKYIYGENLISVPIPNIINLLFDEVLHPFYLFQLFSVILWYVEVYYTYATAIIIISSIGAIIGVVQARKNLLNLKRLAEFECPVSLLTQNGFKSVSSRQLVPGDVVQIREALVLPCDMVLLKGQCVINESMLTGESVPVVKSAVVPDEYDTYNPAAGKHAKYTLFGGTHVLQIKQTNSPIVSAKNQFFEY